jgi:hypothetical protein
MPNVISNISDRVLYADDTSLIMTYSDVEMFKKYINIAIQRLNRGFNSNLSLLNSEKTYFFQFLTRNKKVANLNISDGKKHIFSVHAIKFLDLMIKIYHSTSLSQLN